MTSSIVDSMYEIDIGNLVATRMVPLESSVEDLTDFKVTEELLKTVAEEGVKLLVTSIFELPTEPAEVGRMARLPAPTIEIPREKPVPEPKPLTRWEQYAKERGIKNTKRDRMVWDEKTDEWKPRYGANRANDEAAEWAIEHDEAKHLESDPFTMMNQEKKDRMQKNKRKQARNLLEAAGERVPGTVDLSSAIKRAKNNQGKKVNKPGRLDKKTAHVNSALQVAQVSTASMGKFDTLNKGESVPVNLKRAPTASKMEREKNMAALDVQGEKSSNVQIMNRILGGSRSKKVDTRNAVHLQKQEETFERTNKRKMALKKKMKK